MPQPTIEKPTKLTPIVRQRLEAALAIDATVEEACYYAGVSKQSYYNWVNSDEELKEYFDSLRNKPVLKARQTVVNSLDEPEMALKYLERKKKNEFSLRSELTGEDGKDLIRDVNIKFI